MKAAVMELSAYLIETLREDGEFILHRGQHRSRIDGVLPPILVVEPVGEHPAPGSLRRLEHEYSLRAELDPGWAVRPLTFAQHQGRTMLVLEDPGGEPLDRFLGRVDELFDDNPHSNEMYQSQKGLAQFLIPRGNTSKLLQIVEEPFYLLTEFVEVFIIV